MTFARIAVLIIALAAGGVAALLVGGRSAPTPVATVETPELASIEVLVAAGEIPMGSVINAGNLAWRTWPAEGAVSYIQKATRPDALEQTVGAIARQPFAAGEPMNEQKIIKADGSGFLSAILPAGMRALATEISAETGAGGFILPNDRVDVILTQRGEEGKEGFTTSTILTNVRVLAIDQAIADRDGQKVVVGRTATLELYPRQTEILALARQLGTLSLALRPLADATGLIAEGPQDGAINGEVGPTKTIVRFGVAKTASQQ